jgi:hypothetical protein
MFNCLLNSGVLDKSDLKIIYYFLHHKKNSIFLELYQLPSHILC